MGRAQSVEKGASFRLRRPVGVMSSLTRPTRTRQGGAPHLLEDYGRDRQRGRALRAKLAGSFPDRPEEEIEDAVQSACQLFLAEAPGITEPGHAFAWLRTVAHRALIRELDTRRRAVLADPNGPVLDTEEPDARGPAAELIGLEDESDLRFLVEQISSNLSDSRLRVFALWAAGRKRPEIAEQLGMSERAVKKALEQIMHDARETLAYEAGGGCEEGRPSVMRMAYGLAEAGEAARARLHIRHCGRCSEFSEALEGWREKAARFSCRSPRKRRAPASSDGPSGESANRSDRRSGTSSAAARRSDGRRRWRATPGRRTRPRLPGSGREP